MKPMAEVWRSQLENKMLSNNVIRHDNVNARHSFITQDFQSRQSLWRIVVVDSYPQRKIWKYVPKNRFRGKDHTLRVPFNEKLHPQNQGSAGTGLKGSKVFPYAGYRILCNCILAYGGPHDSPKAITVGSRSNGLFAMNSKVVLRLVNRQS